ncbi:MAG: phosphatase PAP2 family protein [Myxococcaceae bacterium]|nr:phosphatase PAP2 family protein [Myxococcaceae bacterium]
MSAAWDFRLPGDEPVMQALNGTGLRGLDALAAAASSPWFGLPVLLVMAVWLLVRRTRAPGWALLQLFLAVGVTDFVGSHLLKPWVGRVRPCFSGFAEHVRLMVVVGHGSPSMPSLHAANAFAVAVTLRYLAPETAVVMFPVAAVIALSRIFVGVHWPSDVLLGSTYGVLVAVGLERLVRKLRERGAAPAVVAPAEAQPSSRSLP